LPTACDRPLLDALLCADSHSERLEESVPHLSMETAAAVDPTMASKSKDPLASCNIPEVIEDRKGEGDGMLIYKRGKLLGKVRLVASSCCSGCVLTRITLAVCITREGLPRSSLQPCQRDGLSMRSRSLPKQAFLKLERSRR
jgi:hypothetical protein